MKEIELGDDNIVCPACKHKSMIEYEYNNFSIKRKCTNCKYEYVAACREMKNL